MPRTNGIHTPHNGDPGFWVRFCAADYMAMAAEADTRALPMAAFIRMICLEWLEARRGK